MAPPEERDILSEREPLRPEQTPRAAAAPEAAPATDDKIRELEAQLEQLRQRKAGEQTERLRTVEEEGAELAARKREQEQYRAMGEAGEREPGAAPADAVPGAAAERRPVTAQELLAGDPEQAVATLFALASKSAGGFEKAITLARSIAAQPGGAWILDEFHKRMTQSKGAGGAPEAGAPRT